ncbi:membrane protein [Dyella lipolytica]|nr:membrane protein [Dyella lipolytica]
MRAYRQRDPRMLERHMHRYVNAAWRRRQRLESLSQHYRFTLAQLPRSLFNAIYAQGHASLGMLVAKDGTLLALCLRPPIFMGCEGELCLQLNDANGHPLYRIVFSIVDEHRPRIVIGCLQGPNGENAREVVRVLTRNLHGMRPKQLMLSLVYAFARRYGIEQIVAISNAQHPLRRAGRPLHSDYDAFWEEQQGKPVDGGWYALPSSQTHKSEADVPSNHRSAFRRREALRLQAEQLLANALGQPACRVPESLAPERQAAYRPMQNFRETLWVS